MKVRHPADIRDAVEGMQLHLKRLNTLSPTRYAYDIMLMIDVSRWTLGDDISDTRAHEIVGEFLGDTNVDTFINARKRIRDR